jgi:hypothetical protein
MTPSDCVTTARKMLVILLGTYSRGLRPLLMLAARDMQAGRPAGEVFECLARTLADCHLPETGASNA